MRKHDVLATATRLICGDRAESYGDFGEQMRSISRAFEGITGRQLSPSDVALILQLLKLRRMQTSPDVDSAVDLCGYTALYAEAFLLDGQTQTEPVMITPTDTPFQDAVRAAEGPYRRRHAKAERPAGSWPDWGGDRQ